MSSLRSGPAGAGPVLVVRTRQSDHRLHAGTSYQLGRDPGSDIVLSDSRVSWRHATLRHEQDTWILEDAGSTNGTFVGTRRVDRITISSDCVIRLGNPEDGPVLRCEPAARPVHAPTEISTPDAGALAPDGEPGTAVLDDAAVQDQPRRDSIRGGDDFRRDVPPRDLPPYEGVRREQFSDPYEQSRDLRHDGARDVRRGEGRPATPGVAAPGAPGAPVPGAAGPYVPDPHVPGPRTPTPGNGGPGGNGAPGGNGGPAGYGPNGGGGRSGGGRVQPQKDYRLSVDRRPTAVLPLPARRLRIGRTSDNDLVLSDLSISRRHAELRKTSDGKYQIVDLGSHNGTFVNGQRVTSATLTEKDIVGIGHATFRLTDGELREYIDTGDVSLVAQDLVVQVSGGKVLLDHVSFPLAERCLVGIIGPSGAGKSTLLGALTGMRPCLSGTVSSIWELVKERTIYVRERAAGLSSGAYLFSKLIVLGFISVVQAVILVAIGLLGHPLPATGSFLTGAPFAELLLGIAVLGVSSMCLGLMVSALVSTTERAMPFLVLITMVQVVLSGGVVSIAGKMGLEQVAWLVPGRWGFAAVASTADLNHLLPPKATPFDSLWQHQASTWLTDMGAMIALSAVFVLIAWWQLNRLSPGRRK